MAKRLTKTQDRTIRNQRPACTGVVAASMFALFALLPVSASGQAGTIEIPSATPLSVELVKHVPMKTGEPLQARLLYPIYVNNRIAIPAGGVLRGKVIRLGSDRSRRIRARLRGDFTPFHIPVVRFDQMVLPDGTLQSISSEDAGN